MPIVCGTPLSEYGSNIAINAFPILFPTGRGGFDEPRQYKVSEKDWANYLLQLWWIICQASKVPILGT